MSIWPLNAPRTCARPLTATPLRCHAPRLVAQLGAGAAGCELVARVVRRHGGRLPIARFLQFHQPGAGCCERLSGADPERVPRHATGNAVVS